MGSVVVNIVKLVCRYRWEILYHFDRKFTRCYALRVNLLSSLVHEPKLPLRKFFKFMYREFKWLVKLFGCVI